MVRYRRARLLAAAAALALAPRVARAQQLEKMRLAGVPTDDMTPVFYALKNGLYLRAGLDLEVVAISSGSAATTAVIAGAYELGKASPIAPILAHLKGLPITIIANGAVSQPRNPFSGMIVAADAAIKTGADCDGKIGVSPGLGDINSLAMMTWIDKNGGDSKTVKWVEVPGSAVGTAVGDHRVDFGLLQEPQLAAALETGKVRILADAYAAVSNRWLTSSYITLRNSRQTPRRCSASRTSLRSSCMHEHEAETVAMMSR